MNFHVILYWNIIRKIVERFILIFVRSESFDYDFTCRQIYFWIQEHLHLYSSCVCICHIFCMHVHIHAVHVCIFPVMHECSMFAEIAGNYKLFGTPDSQRSHCAIVVTICGMQDEPHGQCTYSIKLRDIHLVIVAVEKQ